MSLPKRFFWLIGGLFVLLITGILIVLFSGLSVGGILFYTLSDQDSEADIRIKRLPDYVASSAAVNSTPTKKANQESGSPNTEPNSPIAATSVLDPAESANLGTENNNKNRSISPENSNEIDQDTTAQSGETTTDTTASTNVSAAKTSIPTSAALTANVAATTPTEIFTPSTTETLTPTPTKTFTPLPTKTSTPKPTETSSPTPTPTATNTPLPVPGSIAGRLLKDGVPASNVMLKLEDRAFKTIASISTDGSGSFKFADLTSSSEGYLLVFTQEDNAQFQIEEVISWGWLGPVAVEDGLDVQLPDFDIAIQGFEPNQPSLNASFSATDVSGANPIRFEWGGYPGATAYWLDLASEQGPPIWTSSSDNTSLTFDGTLDEGSHIEPGEYWWGVGTRSQLGSYDLTVYGYLPVFIIEP